MDGANSSDMCEGSMFICDESHSQMCPNLAAILQRSFFLWSHVLRSYRFSERSIYATLMGKYAFVG